MAKGINYITENLEQSGTNLIGGLFDTFHKNNIANYLEGYNGYYAKEHHSYFDTTKSNSTLYSRGGYCRLVKKEIGAPHEKTEYFVDFLYDKGSKPRRFKLEQEFDETQIANICGIKDDLNLVFEATSMDYHFFFQKVDLELMFTSSGAFIDLIARGVTINNNDKTRVFISSIQDRTRAMYGEKEAEKHKDKINDCFTVFDSFMKTQPEFEECKDNMYATLLGYLPEKKIEVARLPFPYNYLIGKSKR